MQVTGAQSGQNRVQIRSTDEEVSEHRTLMRYINVNSESRDDSNCQLCNHSFYIMFNAGDQRSDKTFRTTSFVKTVSVMHVAL